MLPISLAIFGWSLYGLRYSYHLEFFILHSDIRLCRLSRGAHFNVQYSVSDPNPDVRCHDSSHLEIPACAPRNSNGSSLITPGLRRWIRLCLPRIIARLLMPCHTAQCTVVGIRVLLGYGPGCHAFSKRYLQGQGSNPARINCATRSSILMYRLPCL